MKTVRPVFVVGGSRVPFQKSLTVYREVRRGELLREPLRALSERYALRERPLGDVALGALMNSSSDWNLAREAVLGSGLHPRTPAYNVQRACGTSLETTLQIALKIAHGQIEDGIAGGADTNSDLPIELSQGMRDMVLGLERARSWTEWVGILSGFKPEMLRPKPPVVIEPRTGLSMGDHCELMVSEWKIPREEQDLLAYQSHMNAVKAYENGFYRELVTEFAGHSRDGTIRPDTTLEKLARLRPSFNPSTGFLTAGNSSPLTDGAAAVLLASEGRLKERGWEPRARFIDAQVAALDFEKGEGLLMAPTLAVAQLLKRNGLKLQDFDYYEIHEAFAGQVLCTLRAWESDAYCRTRLGEERALGPIDRSRMNVAGGSVALGHPFAATGARIVASLATLLRNKGRGRGLISICTAGGMGVAAILESA